MPLLYIVILVSFLFSLRAREIQERLLQPLNLLLLLKRKMMSYLAQIIIQLTGNK